MSLTYVGVIVGVLALILPKLGLEISSADLTTTISVIVQLVGAAVALYGRWRLGGVTFAGLRK